MLREIRYAERNIVHFLHWESLRRDIPVKHYAMKMGGRSEASMSEHTAVARRNGMIRFSPVEPTILTLHEN
jgi:hypothetical protein